MTSAAILTGGQARRLQGRDKSRLPAWPGGPAILDHQLAALDAVAGEILIVTSRERSAAFSPRTSPPPIRIVIDRAPGTGPLGAIVTALEATAAETVVVVGGDMPGISPGAIRELLRIHDAAGADVTAPESTRGLEPLFAIYARSALAPLTAALDSGERSLQRALQALRLNRVAAASLAAFGDIDALFRNINTPADL